MPGRIYRWLHFFAEYIFSIQYNPGKYISSADFLYRNHLTGKDEISGVKSDDSELNIEKSGKWTEIPIGEYSGGDKGVRRIY